MPDATLWANLVRQVTPLVKANVPEDLYHQLFESYLKTIFGWSDAEVEHKRSFVSGTGSVQIDTMLTAQGTPVVVEMKKPTSLPGDKEGKQLVSYMNLSQSKFGLLVGSVIQVFYRDDSTDDDPKRVAEIPFDATNEDGTDLAAALDRSSFTESRLRDYCIERIRRQETERELEQHKTRLLADDGQRIRVILADKFISDGYTPEYIDRLLGDIEFCRTGTGARRDPEKHFNLTPQIQIQSEAAGRNGITRDELIAGILELHHRNPDLLKEMIGLNVTTAAPRSKTFSKVRLFSEPKVSSGGQLRSKEIAPGIHVYVNLTNKDAREALEQYQLLFKQGGLHKPSEPHASDSPVFRLVNKKRGTDAKAQLIAGQFTVLKDSVVQYEMQGDESSMASTTLRQFRSRKKRLAELMSIGAILVNKRGTATFTRDIAFNSPSEAGAIVQGVAACNGKTAWISGDGTPYGEWATRQ